MAEPRAYTADEVRDQFLDHIRGMSDYWANVKPVLDAPELTLKERLDGLAFSIMAALDGSSGGLPGFAVIPCPHPDDAEYHRQRGDNWYPRTELPDDVCDIAGDLHDNFYKK